MENPLVVAVQNLDEAGLGTGGDERVRHAVWRMTAHLRPYDEMGRIGPAEFLAILPAWGKAEVKQTLSAM